MLPQASENILASRHETDAVQQKKLSSESEVNCITTMLVFSQYACT